jgi:hypothetical protein
MTEVPVSERPVYRLLFQPKAGVDIEKALRRLLKFALLDRANGLTAIG